jgi:hypothetical protein
MKTSKIRFIPFLAACFATGCDQEDTLDTQKTSKAIQSRKINATESFDRLEPPPPKKERPVEVLNRDAASEPRLYSDKFPLLRSTFNKEKFRSTPRDALNAEWRSIVTSIAGEKGVDESTVLAEFYRAYPNGDAMQSFLGKAYAEQPRIATKSFLDGLEGRSKSNALSSFSATLSDSNNIVGLEDMYDMVPPGKDRSPIADTLIRTICRTEGIERALVRLNSLDFQEEKRLALLGMIPTIKEMDELPPLNELNRFYEAAKELGFEDIARRRIEGPAIKPFEED